MLKMLQRLQIKGFVAGVLVTLLMSAVTVAAAVRTENITVTFRNIRIVVNNSVIVPRDAQGRVVEPFIWNDTVFLPIRAVGDAVGMDANWVGSTNTAYLTNRTVVATPTPTPAGNVPQITTATLDNARVGQAYNVTLNAAGSTPITWSISLGALPAGLSLNATTGAITGTPTTAGRVNFTVVAQNVAGTSSVPLSIYVEAAAASGITLPNRRLTVQERNDWIADYNARGGSTAVEREIVRLINVERANRNLTQVTMDDALMRAARFFAQQANDLRNQHTGTHNFGPYATNPAATHGASAEVARVFGGHLGTWNGGNWSSSGTSTAEAVVSGWVASEGHRNFILAPEHRVIGVGQFPGGITYMFMGYRASTPGQPAGQFTVTFNANGGTGSMQPQGFSQGQAQALSTNMFVRTGFNFAGWATTPTGTAQYTNNQSITVTANRTLYAVWQAPASAVPIITTTTLPNAVIHQAYNQSLAATGGGVTWSIVTGALPPGLTLNANNGAITGTATTLGTFTFTVRATNVIGNVTRDLQIIVQAPGTGNIQVNNVVGQTEAAARTSLQGQGFVVSVAHAASTVVSPGLVISQDPGAGSLRSHGDTISIVVSTGPTGATASVTGITVSTVTSVFMRGEIFPSTAVVIHATWSDGRTPTVVPASSLTVTPSAFAFGSQLMTAGAHSVTFTYSGFSASTTITVV